MTTTIKIYFYKIFSIVKSTGETVSTESRAEITKFKNIINNYDSVIDEALKFVLFIKLVSPDPLELVHPSKEHKNTSTVLIVQGIRNRFVSDLRS